MGVRYESGTPGRADSGQTWAGGMPSEFRSSTTAGYIYSVYAGYTPDQQDQDIELIGNPYMFTGRRFDLETGLYYYRARYYNPYIGRFLQTDPIGYSDGINWYNYCSSNPLNCLDPSGCISGDPITTTFEGSMYLYNTEVGELYVITGVWNVATISYRYSCHPDDISYYEEHNLIVVQGGTWDDYGNEWDSSDLTNGDYYHAVESLEDLNIDLDALTAESEEETREPIRSSRGRFVAIAGTAVGVAGADGPLPIGDAIVVGGATYVGLKWAIKKAFRNYRSKQAAKKAARKASAGGKKPIHHGPNPGKGHRGHYHPRGPRGIKLPDHYRYPWLFPICPPRPPRTLPPEWDV